MTNNISEKVQLGKTDIRVSPVGFGVLPMGPNQLALPTDEGAELICYALRHGINFIDTAQYYKTSPYIRRALEMLGLAEGELPVNTTAECENQSCGNALDGSRSDSSDALPIIARPVISSKTLKTDYDGAYSAILEECEALGVRYIDIFLLHEVRSGQFAERRAAWQALKDAKSAGLVKAIGISTHHVDVVEELTAVPECDVIFPLLNCAGMGVRRGSEASSCEDMAAAVAAAAFADKGIYIMKALGGGNLASSYQTALDYVFAQPAVSSVMLGFGCKHDIDDILSYMDGSMPADYSPDVSEKRVRINQEDCEGCGSCLRICHSQAIAYNKNGLAEIDQSKCITCGYCAQSCPVRAIIMY